MSAFGEDVADDLDTSSDMGADVGTPDLGEQSADGNDLQDRMSEELDDDAWYSDSTGAVVDKDGNPYVDKNGKPFKSMQEYQAAQKASSENPAKPKTEEAKVGQKPKPMSRSFEKLVSENGIIDANTLLDIGKAEAAYKYSDELVPAVRIPQAGQQQVKEPEMTPTQKVEQLRETLEAHLVWPLTKISKALLDQGYEQSAVDAFMAPHVREQQALIDKEYRQKFAEALREEAKSEVNPIVTEENARAIKAKSDANVEKLATAYFPKGGSEAFLALINGHNEIGADGKETFVRGPAAHVLDLLVSVGNQGKEFASNEEVQKAYKDTFLQLTSKPETARILFKLVNDSYKGMNVHLALEHGKQKGLEQAQQIRKFVKPKPQNAAPVEEEDPNMPSMLRSVLNSRGHYA